MYKSITFVLVFQNCPGCSRSFEFMSGIELSWREFCCQVSEQVINTTVNQNEALNHLLGWCKQEAETVKSTNFPQFYFPPQNSTPVEDQVNQCRQRSFLMVRVIPNKRLWQCFGPLGQRQRAELRVEEYWIQSQSGEKCLQNFPPTPVRRPQQRCLKTSAQASEKETTR